MFVFALMGTVYGLWEEIPAYAIVVIPMFLAAGYDVMTGIMVVLVGCVAGNMADVVNPYAIGAAVAAIGNPDLGMGDGIVLRMILFVVLLAMGAFFVIKYANTVKKNPEKSAVAGIEGVGMNTSIDVAEIKPLTTKHKLSLIIFGLVIIVTIIGYVPWDSIGDGESVFNVVNTYKNWSGTFIGNLLGVDGLCEFAWWYSMNSVLLGLSVLS